MILFNLLYYFFLLLLYTESGKALHKKLIRQDKVALQILKVRTQSHSYHSIPNTVSVSTCRQKQDNEI